jgi:hypothetical protein
MLQALLFLAPALLLVLPLLTRRYPGERILITRQVERTCSWSRPRSSAPRKRRSLPVAVHGGRLIGRSLAVRPPPALLVAS